MASLVALGALVALVALGAILSLALISCDMPNSGGASASIAVQTPQAANATATPTYTPSTPTACGFIYFGPPGRSAANDRHIIGCLVISFQQCHTVQFVYEFFGATDQGRNELSHSGTVQTCRTHVQQHDVSTKNSAPTATDYTYTCFRLDQMDGHYVILAVTANARSTSP